MVCNTYSLVGNEEFMALLNDRVCGGRIPLCGSMDLTDRCNINCVHCYIRQDADPKPSSPLGGEDRGEGVICNKSPEMLTAQACSYIDQLAEAGCLFFLITGGEPLLRDDFREIYEHAKRAGLVVSLFTNATLVDESMADFLADFLPHTVEISIYGATAAAHDRVTGVDGSFEKTMRGFKLLKDRGIDVSLKTILMTLNRDELEGMLDIAKVNGVKFRVDGAIFPRLDGDKGPLELRLKPEEVVEREFMIPGATALWREFIEKIGTLEAAESLYDCGAGVSCFHITSGGWLKPCLMASEPSFDLKKMTFADAWRDMAVISDRKVGADYPCAGCERRVLCDSCPGFFGLEMGDEGVYSEYVCDIAKERSIRLYR
jgi:MoaA/NifB/PqqE/SkfB family radical SAM enzyme